MVVRVLDTRMSKQSGNEEASRPVQAVATSCDIIRALRELDSAGVTELADHLDISKATAHNHLATLRQYEFVRKEGDTYDVSFLFIDYGEYAKNSSPIYDLAVGETETLAETTGEVASFMVEEHGKGVYLHKTSGEKAVQTYSYVGDRKHLHCSALGKAILAYTSRERVFEIIDKHGLPKRTENTITDEEVLLDELEKTRDRGYAVDNEEAISGLRCVAAPVIGHKGELHGAISVSGPIRRFKDSYFKDELPEIVLEATNIIKINTAQL